MTRTARRQAFDPKKVKGSDAFLEREFPMSARNFEAISSMAYESSGIVLSESKQEMVYSRLARRLRALGISNFNDYLTQVVDNVNDESTSFLNAITTNLTSFFRENHHFEYLKDVVIPELKVRHKSDRKIRVWCTAASTGEEPYSIAMIFKEAFLSLSNWDIKILATDIDSNVLSKATTGIYRKESVADIDAKRRKKWFRSVNQDRVEVHPELKQMLTFRQLNLLKTWPMKNKFDVVFCRNVIIYFDKETQRNLFARIHTQMADVSNLFIGHSESLHNVSDQFKSLGGTVYERK